MTVVILCGGLGTRIRDVSEILPKPMVPIGPYPIVWHIMRHYAHFGHKDFVLCLGYKKEVIIDFFTNYHARSRDVTITLGKEPVVEYHETAATEDWRVTLADTGIKTATGGRIKRAMKYVKGDELFMTYGDGVSNIDVAKLQAQHRRSGKLATICGVHPAGRFGEIAVDGNAVVSFSEKPQVTEGYINGGFMVLSREFVDRYLTEDCVLESDALAACAREGKLGAYLHDDFWQCMDTAREYQLLNELWEKSPPWKVW